MMPSSESCDLLEKRESDERKNTVLVRIEQLYPFRNSVCRGTVPLSEPEASGLVSGRADESGCLVLLTASYVPGGSRWVPRRSIAGREMAAAPAAGSMALHIEQQQRLVQDAFEIK